MTAEVDQDQILEIGRDLERLAGRANDTLERAMYAELPDAYVAIWRACKAINGARLEVSRLLQQETTHDA